MKLLLIMPNFFDYPEQISQELNKMGYEVNFYDDRPSTNTLIKAAVRINKNIIRTYIKKYFSKILNETSSKEYDIVLVISGQSLSFDENMIKDLKESQKKAKFVLYQWDSQKNFPYIIRMQKYFDKCYTFDRRDSRENDKLIFLPLFYSDRYKEIGQNRNDKCKYDFCFVGTAHPKKYKFIKIMSEQLKSIYQKQFVYFYLPSKLVYIYRKIKNKEFKDANISEFNFKPLSSKEMNELYVDSKCVLDSPQDNQVGLTIRVIETLGAKKKLITTNKDVVNYDFFNESNIYIYDGDFDFTSEFFNSEYIELPKKIYEKYSLKKWLETLLK